VVRAPPIRETQNGIEQSNRRREGVLRDASFTLPHICAICMRSMRIANICTKLNTGGAKAPRPTRRRSRNVIAEPPKKLRASVPLW